MASKKSGSSIIDCLEDIAECAICNEVYTEPRLLPCAHTFCLRCLEAYGKGKKPGDKVLCPVCRKKFAVPQGGWKNLQRNLLAQKLLDLKCDARPASDANCVDRAEPESLSNMIVKRTESLMQSAQVAKEKRKKYRLTTAELEQTVIHRRDEVKQWADSSAVELLGRLKSIREETVREMEAKQNDVDGQIVQLNNLLTRSKEAASSDLSRNDVNGNLSSLMAEFKAIALQRSDCLTDTVVSLTPADMRLVKDQNVIGRIEVSKRQLAAADELSVCAFPVPSLVGTITADNGGDAVVGLGIIDDFIYIVRSWTSKIEVRNATSFHCIQHLAVPGLDLPHDMATCSANKCLYLSDYGSDVHRIETAAGRSKSQTKWSAGDKPTGLSVTSSSASVVITFESGQKVKEFTTRGELLRVLSLPSNVVNPHHAMLLSTGQLLICHGFESDPLNRVCLIDAGNVARVLGPEITARDRGQSVTSRAGEVEKHSVETASRLTQPIRLALDESHGILFVADFKNDRILVVDLSTLNVTCTVTSAANGLKRPHRICVDGKGLLYIGSWETGEVMIYNTGCR